VYELDRFLPSITKLERWVHYFLAAALVLALAAPVDFLLQVVVSVSTLSGPGVRSASG